MPLKPLPQHTIVSVTDTLLTKERVRKAALGPLAADGTVVHWRKEKRISVGLTSQPTS